MTALDVAPPAPAPVLTRPPGRAATVAAWAVLGLVAVVLAVALAGAAPQPAPPGLPDAGPVPGWGLPLVRLAGHAAVLLLVAVLLGALLGAAAVRRTLLVAAATAWAATSVAAYLLTTAEVVGRPVSGVLQADLLRFTAVELPQGRALLQSAVLALGVAALAPVTGRRAGRVLALAVALAATVPPLLVGHAAGEGDHRAAQALLVVHVVAAVLWVGGLAGLALTPAADGLRRPVQAFSLLALVCAVAVGATGVASAVLRLETPAALASGYGALVLLKTAALGLLVLAGARHRRTTLSALTAGAPGAFRRLAVAEVAVMAVAFGLAAALARTPGA